MRARWWVNLVLLLVVSGLALAIRLEAVRGASPPTLAGLDPADLRLISVERTGEPRVRIERTGDGWRLREPMDTDADLGQVDKLLRVLSAPVHRSFPEQAAAPAELGLEPPRIVVRLDGLKLAFGSLDPVTQRRYVAADGLVHLIDDGFYAPLIAPPLDYAARAPTNRGRPPVFGTLNGVPLSAAALKTLAGLRAERLEPMTGELGGEPLELKSADGSALHFLASEDRRRLTRVDLKLRYVLTDPLVLDLDPSAVDNTPPLPPSAPGPDLGLVPGLLPEPGYPGGRSPPVAGPGAAAQAGPPGSDPFAPQSDPDSPVPQDGPAGPPPEVRLSPDQPAGEVGPGFGAEPYKTPPEGFGTDPFAPDPALDPSAGGAPEAP
jgi:hypothetical protein